MSAGGSEVAGSRARRTAPRNVNVEDVDDVIGIAAEMQEIDLDRLSVEDLEEVAADLDIPKRYVEPAIAELRRRREAVLAADARRRRARRFAIGIGLGVLAVLMISALVTHSKLTDLETEAARARAQVVNVSERQAASERQWNGLPDSPEKRAELSGAENRVRIERMRYDEAVTAYNAAASGFFAGLWRRLFGHPEALPLSTELASP